MGTFYIEDVTVASNIPSTYMTQKKSQKNFMKTIELQSYLNRRRLW